MAKRNAVAEYNQWVSSAEGGEWEPKAIGDQFEGELTGRRMVQTKFGLKPVLTLVDKNTGECIDVFSTNMNLRRLNLVPIGTRVMLKYAGETQVKIGRKMKTVKDIRGFYPVDTKLEEGSWALVTGAKIRARKTAKPAKKAK